MFRGKQNEGRIYRKKVGSFSSRSHRDSHSEKAVYFHKRAANNINLLLNLEEAVDSDQIKKERTQILKTLIRFHAPGAFQRLSRPRSTTRKARKEVTDFDLSLQGKQKVANQFQSADRYKNPKVRLGSRIYSAAHPSQASTQRDRNCSRTINSERNNRSQEDTLMLNTINGISLEKLTVREIPQKKGRKDEAEIGALQQTGNPWKNSVSLDIKDQRAFSCIRQNSAIRRMQKVNLVRSDAIDKKIIEKYGKLIDCINDSKDQQFLESYDDYQEKLFGKINLRKVHQKQKWKMTKNFKLNEQWR